MNDFINFYENVEQVIMRVFKDLKNFSQSFSKYSLFYLIIIKNKIY